jgi:hypothetical protein
MKLNDEEKKDFFEEIKNNYDENQLEFVLNQIKQFIIIQIKQMEEIASCLEDTQMEEESNNLLDRLINTNSFNEIQKIVNSFQDLLKEFLQKYNLDFEDNLEIQEEKTIQKSNRIQQRI